MKRKSWILGIVALMGFFIITPVLYDIEKINSIASQFYGALTGVVITAIITVLLLEGQAYNEEKKDRSLKIFEKKQDVYHEFLEELKNIVKDGEIVISKKDEVKDELKELLFQLSYVQMHTSDENMQRIFEEVSEIIRNMNDFNVSDEYKQKHLPEYYASLSEHLFEIVSLLKNDLYGGKKSQPIQKKQIARLLEDCDLFIESEDVDRHALQKYFWDELQRQFKERKYELEYKDFTKDINEYYIKGKSRYRYYGIEMPIYTTQKGEVIKLSIDIKNDYCYGIKKEYSDETNQMIRSILGRISKSFVEFDTEKINKEKWNGCKFSDRYNLDFWTFDSLDFKRLKNPRKREALITDIVNEIEKDIEEFEELANENKL